MTKHIKQGELAVDWIGEDELMGGRNYVRQLYSKSEGYDIAQYEFWRAYLENIAMSAFEWVNLPAGIDQRAIEYILMEFGQGAAFSEDGGMLFAQAMPADNINMYYNPNEINLFAPSGQFWTRHCNYWVDGNGDVCPRDAVICFDNMLRTPITKHIKNYARRLAEIDRVIDVNIGAQKTPWIITGGEEAKATKKMLVRKLEANEQYISVNDAMQGTVGYNVLNTQAPYVADKLLEAKKTIMDEAITFLGADNANTDKRERLNTHEVLANNEQVMLMRNSRLRCRKDFCRYVNTVFADLLDEPLDVQWSVPHLAEPEGMAFMPSGETSMGGGE